LKLCGEATDVLKCPRCGEPEILRERVDDKILIVFGCMLSVYLPADKDEEEIQRILDEWDRSGKMDEWLKTAMRLGVD